MFQNSYNPDSAQYPIKPFVTRDFGMSENKIYIVK